MLQEGRFRVESWDGASWAPAKERDGTEIWRRIRMAELLRKASRES